MKSDSLVLPEAQEQRKDLLSIIDRAVSTPDFDIEKLRALLEMKERWDANEARKAFAASLSKFKERPPTITKNKHVHFETSKGTVDYWHASLDHVCDVVATKLQEFGISHRWETVVDGEWITVTCILTHALGHVEKTTLKGAPDQTGSKNSLQAVGSTVTYLQRYTLLAATGLAAQNTDNDGAGGATVGLDQGHVTEQVEFIMNARDIEEVWSLYKVAYKEAKEWGERGDQKAIAAYVAAKDKRKAELS